MGGEKTKIETGPETSEAPGTRAKLDRLKKEIESDPRVGIERESGIKLNDLPTEPDTQWAALDKFIAAFTSVFGALDKCFEKLRKALGGAVSTEEVVAHMKEPGAEHEETKKPKPEGWDMRNEKMPWEDWRSARHAALTLKKNPEMKDWVHEAHENHGIPEATIVAFIEMESSFKSAHIGKGGIGLGQADPQATSEYRNEVNKDANLKDPQTAIDFVAWYSVKLIAQVGWEISKNGETKGYKGTYAIDEHDTENLYLAYNCGAEGYLKLRRYLDNRSDENLKALPSFLRVKKNYRGKEMPRFEMSIAYAKRVSNVAQIYDSLEKNDAEIPPIDTPPLPKGALRISSGFGHREHPTLKNKKGEALHQFHNGVDYATPVGTSIFSVKAGRVQYIHRGSDGISGRYISIRHDDGTISEYLHLSEVDPGLIDGTPVFSGQELGRTGDTGRVTGPHLHFIYKNAKGHPVDPQRVVQEAAQR